MTAAEMLRMMEEKRLPDIVLWKGRLPARRRRARPVRRESAGRAERTARRLAGGNAARRAMQQFSPAAFPGVSGRGGRQAFKTGGVWDGRGGRFGKKFPAASRSFPAAFGIGAARGALWREQAARKPDRTGAAAVRQGALGEERLLLAGLAAVQESRAAPDTERIFAELERRLAVELGAG